MVPVISKYLPITAFVIRILRKTETHGAKHLAQNDRNSMEYFFWVVTVISMFFLMLYTASLFWVRHFLNPTVISIDRNYITNNTTFPSLTICYHDKVNETALAEYVKHVKPDNDTELEWFLRELVNFHPGNLLDLVSYPNLNESDYVVILDKISKHFHNQVTFATGQTLPFRRTITELGVCYTVNSMIADYISPEYIIKDTPISSQPVDVFQVNFYDDTNIASISNLSDLADIYLHGPYDIPSPVYVRRLDRARPAYTNLLFQPFIVQSDSDVRTLLYEQRNCRFSDEGSLEHFPNYYSYSLCKANCKINGFIRYCGCVPFYYKARGANKYCTMADFSCIQFFRGEVSRNDCGCLQNCNDLQFILKSFKSLLWFQNSTITWEMEKIKIRYKREIIHRLSDALIASGANASLFLGVTALSAMEFFYFAVIELYTIFKQNRLIRFLLGKRPA